MGQAAGEEHRSERQNDSEPVNPRCEPREKPSESANLSEKGLPSTERILAKRSTTPRLCNGRCWQADRQTDRLVWPGSCKEGAPRGSRVSLHVAEGLAAAGQHAWCASCSGGTRTTPLLQGPSSKSSDTRCRGRMRSWVSPTAEQEVMDNLSYLLRCFLSLLSSRERGFQSVVLEPKLSRVVKYPRGTPLAPWG